jgi:hypothetical protein
MSKRTPFQIAQIAAMLRRPPQGNAAQAASNEEKPAELVKKAVELLNAAENWTKAETILNKMRDGLCVKHQSLSASEWETLKNEFWNCGCDADSAYYDMMRRYRKSGKELLEVLFPGKNETKESRWRKFQWTGSVDDFLAQNFNGTECRKHVEARQRQISDSRNRV